VHVLDAQGDGADYDHVVFATTAPHAARACRDDCARGPDEAWTSCLRLGLA